MTFAPKASIVNFIELGKTSEKTAVNLRPKAAATNDRDDPVLPPVYSTTLSPFFTFPFYSALDKTLKAILSL